MPDNLNRFSAIQTFSRVLRYALPYKWKIAAILASMVLFSVATLAPIALIKPFVERLTGSKESTTRLIASEEILVTLTDGRQSLLANLLPASVHQPREGWKEHVPLAAAAKEWIRKHPFLKSLLMGSETDVPPVRVDSRREALPTDSLLVFTREGVWGKGEWKPIRDFDPALAERMVSFSPAPRVVSAAAPLWLYALLVPFLYLGKGALGIVRQVLLASVALNVVRDIQNDLYSKVLSQSVGYFRQARTGDLMSRMINDVMILSHQIVNVLLDLLQSPILVVSSLGLAFWIDWQLALILLVVVPLLAIPMQMMSRRIRKASRRAQEKRADISSVLVETLTGIEVVKAFNMEDYERSRYAGETHSLLRKEMRIRKNRAYSTPTTEMGASFGIAAVILIAWWRMSLDPTFGLGDLGQIAATFTIMIKPLDRFWKARFVLGEMTEAGIRIFTVMDRQPSIQDSPNAVALPENWQRIRFENLSFAYGSEPVLCDIDFVVERGQKIAIVGKTGAGKTTLVSLLARFYDPTEGRILIDDFDLRDLRLASLLKQIGIVTQRNILFNDTIARNIAYGRPDIPQSEIEKAAHAAYADEFIEELPQGYDTMVGEMGTRLSGGQAQRLAIARAILKNPPILILDEATASLDTASEQKVQKALDRLMANRTTFAIAHRLSTILNADRILVLYEGRLVESGTHREIYELGGYYQQLYDSQFSREAEGEGDNGETEGSLTHR